MVAWGVLYLTIPPEIEDTVTGKLAWHSLGTESVATGPGQAITLKIYLQSRQQADDVAGEARALLLELGLDPQVCALKIDAVRDGKWVERYQAQLLPFTLGSRFIVYPSGIAGNTPDRDGILLVPGQAFGTGEHATTQLCAEQLELHVQRGAAWCDLGCGTGILSIIARRCGAQHVLALDDDPTAVLVASDVMAANNEGERIQVIESTAEKHGGAGMDGVVVNISAEYLIGAAQDIVNLLRSPGILIASGFMGESAAAVEDAFNAVGLVTIDTFDRAPWAAIVFRRAG
jgi:ribosomal protein L11 methyltransferase